MTNGQWNVRRLMLVGAVVGGVYVLVQAAVEPGGFGTSPEHLARLIGTAIGGAIGGAILFGLIAVIRNFFRRR